MDWGGATFGAGMSGYGGPGGGKGASCGCQLMLLLAIAVVLGTLITVVYFGVQDALALGGG